MKKLTDIEKAVRQILLSLGFSFKMQHKIGNYPVDFYIPKYKLTIQTDGCFFHSAKCSCFKAKKIYPRQIFQQRRDKACIAYHKYHKINIIRLRGCEILESPEHIVKTILSTIERIKDGDSIYGE